MITLWGVNGQFHHLRKICVISAYICLLTFLRLTFITQIENLLSFKSRFTTSNNLVALVVLRPSHLMRKRAP